MVRSGCKLNVNGELITSIAIEKERRFAIREGGHTVCAGVGTEIGEYVKKTK